MEYTKYSKAMVLLSEENRDFAAKGEQAIYGNLRVETGNNKGAISLSVQNLRFFERNKYVYKLILFGEKKERTIHAVIGSLILNRFGSGENYFRFDPSNVDGRGSNFSDYAIAIVAAVSMRDNKEPLHPVLKGKLPFESSVSAAGTDHVEKNSEEIEKEKIEPQVNETGKASRGNGVLPSPPQGAGRSPYDTGAFGQGRDIPKQIPVRKRAIYTNFYNEFLKEICEKTAKSAELYDTITPFSKDRTEARWKRIANVKNIPIVSPGAMWGATKYRHYIFGEDTKMYYLGIPGRFLNEEQPEGGKSGFVLWQPIMGAENLEATKADCSLENRMTAYGYWITAIDKKTGDVLEP